MGEVINKYKHRYVITDYASNLDGVVAIGRWFEGKGVDYLLQFEANLNFEFENMSGNTKGDWVLYLNDNEIMTIFKLVWGKYYKQV